MKGIEFTEMDIEKLIVIQSVIIENRHTGIATIKKEMKNMWLPEPEFKSLRGDFKVILRKETSAIEISKNSKATDSGQKWTDR